MSTLTVTESAATRQRVGPAVGKLSFRSLRQHLALSLSMLLLLPFLLFAVSPETFSAYDPLKTSVRERLEPPNAQHWFGTDELGRDVYTRVVHGARISLSSASVTIALACVVGISLGVIAGYFGGPMGRAIMIAADMVLSFPNIILAMAVVAALGNSIQNAMLAMAAVWWPVYARLMRALTLQLREEEYVQAAYVTGATWLHVIWKHILPNTLSSLVIRVSLDLGFAILLLASLGFVGLGASAPTPEWGTMVSLGRTYFLTEWWIGFFPALAITLVVIATTLVGDELNDLWNPLRT